MTEGSYTQIEKGMRVIAPDGHTLGSVTEVLYDEGSDIFVGLVIQHDSFRQPCLVHGQHIEGLRDRVVHLSVDESAMEPYVSAEERYREVAARNAS